jgi:hypothetical protein
MCVLAAASSTQARSALAVVRRGARQQLYGCVDRQTPQWTRITAQQAAALLSDAARRETVALLEALTQSIRGAHDATALLREPPTLLRRRWLSQFAATVRSTPRHQQSAAIELLAALRARMEHPVPADLERLLSAATRSRARGLALLERVARILGVAGPAAPASEPADAALGQPPTVVGLWLVEAEVRAEG